MLAGALLPLMPWPLPRPLAASGAALRGEHPMAELRPGFFMTMLVVCYAAVR